MFKLSKQTRDADSKVENLVRTIIILQQIDVKHHYMSSFKEVRELLLVAYDSEIINDEEFLVLFENYRSRNPQFPYNSYPRFELENMQDDECLTEFRVKKEDVPRLADVLQIPETVRCEQRSVCGRIEGLCMLLRRLAYPCRYSDMIHRFARPVPEICMITNTVMDFIFDHHAHRLTQWNPSIMNAQALQSYADAVSARGAPLQNCFGFVDGTVRPIARPGEHQRLVYNGHKRVHSLKFQSLALPNGLIANMYGPIGEQSYANRQVALITVIFITCLGYFSFSIFLYANIMFE